MIRSMVLSGPELMAMTMERCERPVYSVAPCEAVIASSQRLRKPRGRSRPLLLWRPETPC